MPSLITSDPELAESRRQINWRDDKSFAHAREIHKPYGTIDLILAWCRSELIGDWRWQLVDLSSQARPGRYIFYFDSDRDCCAFSLKWC